MKTRLWIGLLVGLLAAPLLAEDVALFINDAYVDYDPGDFESEAWRLEVTIPLLGHNLTTFSSIVAADITAAVAGQDALVIPELENSSIGDELGSLGNFALDLGPDGRQAIADFVSGGGNLLVFGSSHCQALELLDLTFGIAAEPAVAPPCVIAAGPDGETRGGNGPWSLDQGIASGNTFEGGPASLIYINDTTDLLTSSLPGNALSFYTDLNGSAVAAFPSGAGYVFFLGYDFGRDDFVIELPDETLGQTPPGLLDWEDVLDRSIRFPGGGVAVDVLAVPTLSSLSVSLLVAFLALAAVVALRRQARS